VEPHPTSAHACVRAGGSKSASEIRVVADLQWAVVVGWAVSAKEACRRRRRRRRRRRV